MRSLRSLLVPAGLVLLLAPAVTAQGQVYLLGAEATNGDDFGRAVADAGDVDGDGVPDVIVGAPFDGAGGAQSGSVFVYSGKTGLLIWTRAGEFAGDAFGWSVDGLGDLNGDGKSEVIVGAPLWDNNGAWSANGGKVYILYGATGGVSTTFSFNELNAQMGTVVRGLGDIDGDGVGDLVFTTPYQDLLGPVDGGNVKVFSGAGISLIFSRSGTEVGAKYGYSFDVVRATGSLATSRLIVGAPGVDGPGSDRGEVRLLDGFGNTVSVFQGSTDDEWTGAAVAGIGDANNDGVRDYAMAAPYADILGVGADAGLVRVYSGASTSVLFGVSGATAGANMGSSLSVLGDFNGDGRDDFLAGAPNDTSAATGAGEARVVSGLNGLTLASWHGGLNDHAGRSVSNAGDLNGDGTQDLVFGANDAPFGAGEAYVHLAHLKDPTVYCTAKVNSQGCTPKISATGVASQSIADSLFVGAEDVINQKIGILFWGLGPMSSPFMGGTLCVSAPIKRTPGQSSGGNVGPDDCSGSYTFHFSRAYMAAEAVPAGSRVHAQYWSRDPASLSGFLVGLTDAVSFDVVP